ncbi:hypothetical protein [Azospirillum soli]|uniref:hypothetical protein n=1 Tax=Azospirillum soli TaxID=1304799 RepID=UPI001AE7EE16|nr:hypothetical protein [Azospirillum soli]MBP2315730.1 hypothetical protein [Azospirillum soli]
MNGPTMMPTMMVEPGIESPGGDDCPCCGGAAPCPACARTHRLNALDDRIGALEETLRTLRALRRELRSETAPG